MIKSENRINIRNSIATRLLRSVFGFYLIIAIGVTLGHMAMEYRYQKDNIRHDLEGIQRTFEQSIAINIWQLNQEALLSTIEGMSDIPVIVGVKIQNKDGVDIAVAGIVSHDDITGNFGQHINILGLSQEELNIPENERYRFDVFKHQFPIKYTHEEKTKLLGVATIYSNTSVIFRRVKLSYFLLVLNAVVKTTALWLIFLWFSITLLRKPLETLTSATKNVNLENLDSSKVSIETPGRTELKVLEESFNSMIDNLHQSVVQREKVEGALRVSEEKLRTLFRAMTEMVVLHEMVFNAEGDAINYRIIDCNKAFREALGIEKEKIVGKLATEIYQTEVAPYLTEFSHVSSTGEPYEYNTYFAPMDKHFVVSVVSPRKGQFATITNDISVLKQTQKIITTKNKELENYLYVASHDLRSPLVNIQGFSQRLQNQISTIKNKLSEDSIGNEVGEDIEEIMNEGIPKALNFIYTNVTKMDALIKGLLQISRTGRVKMSVKQIDMNKLIKDIIRSLSFQIEEISAKVTVEYLPDVYGDNNLLNQLFSNIIENAIKYRDKEKPLVISITAKLDYHKVIYSVSDTGIGITERHLEKIWDVFYQVTPKTPDSGDGIGLSVVKRIIDKHMGKVKVESTEGKGSVFYIELNKNDFSQLNNDGVS